MPKDCIPIRVGEKIVGVVAGKLFIKRVKGSVHFLRVPPAIAFDIESILQARKNGATIAQVIDKETNKKYLSPILVILEKGFKINRGYGEQIALEMRYWTHTEAALQSKLF